MLLCRVAFPGLMILARDLTTCKFSRFSSEDFVVQVNVYVRPVK